MAEEENFDVIVVGGGPGGSTCATYLGKAGYKVLLLEKAKFPRDKTCGDAVSGKSVSVLRDFGLMDAIETQPHEKVNGVLFSSPDATIVEIPFPSGYGGNKGFGYVCRREVFDNIVFQHSKKYATVLEQFQVTDLIKENGYVVGVRCMDLNAKKEKTFRGRIIVGADGALSVVARKVNAENTDPKHSCVALRAYYKNIKGLTKNIEIHFINSVLPGYFWIFPLENGTANVGVGMLTYDMQKRAINLKTSMLEAIKNDPLFKERFQGAELMSDIKGWTLPFGSKKVKCYGNGYVLLGDSASLIDPFTGEGIGNSMVSARIASRVIDKALKANDVSENNLKEYDVELWKELGPELKTSYYLQKIGQHKFLLNLIIKKASKSKHVRETISGMLVNEQAKKQFVSPLFYLKLLFG
ncbi:NAD(P)/FAD-dependent oxidoreductase [Candidatus Micrarchaeota archaeon]|nr:NAD(P)/FAD-dependent oxidoreductase [Candidatus Micrarchaeota archaeon]